MTAIMALIVPDYRRSAFRCSAFNVVRDASALPHTKIRGGRLDQGIHGPHALPVRLTRKSGMDENIFRRYNYYSDGVIVILESSPTLAHIRLTKNSFPDESMCVRLSGWMERAVELSGGKKIRLLHPSCVHHGQEYCEWKGAWE